MVWPAGGTPLTNPFATGFIAAIDLYNNITVPLNEYQAYNQAAYTAYTPAFTSSGTTPNLGGSGSALGVYKILGDKTCHFSAQWVWAAGAAVGSGTYLMGLPTPWANDGILPEFTALYVTASAAYRLTAQLASTTVMEFLVGDGTLNVLDPTHPVAPATGNVLRVNGTYRCA